MAVKQKSIYRIVFAVLSIAIAVFAGVSILTASSDRWTEHADVSWYNEDYNTYKIDTPEKLAGIAKLVNDGVSPDGKAINGFSGKILEINNHFDLSAYTWEPIGTALNPFRGTLVTEGGQSFTLTGMNVAADNTYAGLVGLMDGGTVGGFDFASGTIELVSVTQSTYAGAAVGAMANNSMVFNITNHIPIKVSGAGTYVYAGGIVGSGEGSISNSSNLSTVDAAGSYVYTGGIAGRASDGGLLIKKTANAGAIAAGNASAAEVYAGGIVGYASGELLMQEQDTPISNTANVTATGGTASYAGGIAGKAASKITFSASTSSSGAVRVDAQSANGTYAGGLIGAIAAQQGSYLYHVNFSNSGPIENNGGSNVYTGGIAGYIQSDFNWAESYVGQVSVTASGSANVYTGGLIGSVSGDVRFDGAAQNTAEITVNGQPDEAYTGGLIGYGGSRVLFDGAAAGEYANSGKITVNGGTGVYTGGIISNRAYAKLSGEPSLNVESTANIEVNGTAKLYTGGFIGTLSEGSDRTISGAAFAKELKVTAASPTVDNNVRTGGIVGYLVNGVITDSAFQGKLDVTGGDEVYTGGIAGVVSGGSLSGLYAGNAVSSPAQIVTDGYAGGIAGRLKGTVQGAEVTQLSLKVKTAGGTAGGVAGRAQGEINSAIVGSANEEHADTVQIEVAASNPADGADRFTAGGIVGANDGALSIAASKVTQTGFISEAGRKNHSLGAVAGVLTAEAVVGDAGTPIVVEQMLFNVQAAESNVGGAIGVNYSPKVNVTIENAEFKVPAASVHAGAIAGVNHAAFEGAASSLSARAIKVDAQGDAAHIGGLFGENHGAVPASLAEDVTITAAGSDNELGGIAGRNTGALTDNKAVNIAIAANGTKAAAGGIVGRSNSENNAPKAIIANASVRAAAEPMITAAAADSNIGGIAGFASRTKIHNPVVDSVVPDYAMLSVKGSKVAAGGIVGRIGQGAIIGDSVRTNTENVVVSTTAAAANGHIGGIAGYSEDTLLDRLVASKINLIINGEHTVVGGAAGYNRSTDTAIITNVFAETLNVTVNDKAAFSTAGGLVGLNDTRAMDAGSDPAAAPSTIQKSRFVGKVSVAAPSAVTGGWVGENRSLIANNNISDKTPVLSTGMNATVGGFVGLNQSKGTLYYTYSNANLTIKGKNALAGGLVGDNAGRITASYVDIDVTGQSEGTSSKSVALGGLAGRNSGDITKSYSVANVTGTGVYTNVGGLVGEQTAGTITDSYTGKEVKATNANSFAGGFIGRITGGKIFTSYSSVPVSGTNGAFAGGFAGRYDNASKELLYKSYYVKDEDRQINKDLPDFADGNHRFLNVHARLSTILEATLRDRNVFPALSGWDFVEAWKYGSPNASYKYPELNRSANNGGGGGSDVNANIRWYMLDKDAVAFDIGTEAELAGLAAIVNGTIPGLERFDFQDRTIRIVNPIHIQSTQWMPIGSSEALAFEGTFDGGEHLIDGLTILPSQDYSGLFGVIGTNGVLGHVVIEPGSIDGGRYTGVLAGLNKGAVSQVSVKLLNGAGVSGGTVGGIIGKNTGNIAALSLSIADGSGIEGKGAQPVVGGIVGDNASVFAEHTIRIQGGSIGSAAADAIVGGMVGRQTGDAGKLSMNLQAAASIYATGDNSIVGGVIGNHVTGAAENMTAAFEHGKLEAAGNASILGGIIGRSDAGSTLRHLRVTGAGEGPHLVGKSTLGGIVGSKLGSASSSFDMEDLSIKQAVLVTPADSSSAIIGGIAGKLADTAITNLSSQANITAAGENVTAGGIAGLSQNTIILKADVVPNIVFAAKSGESAIGGIVGISNSSDRDKAFDFGRLIPLYHGVYDAMVQGGSIQSTESAQGADLFVGGIAGKNSTASIYQSKAASTIAVSGGKTVAIGGLTGFNDGIIVSSEAQNGILADKGSVYHIGGIAGLSAGGEIHYTKAVSPNGEKIAVGSAVTQPGVVPAAQVGGFVGSGDYTRITNSTSNVPIEINCINPDNTIYAGGFAGLLGDSDNRTGLIQWAYATGSLNVNGLTGAYVGGFAGSVDHYSISDAYASGNVQNAGFDTRSGGFAGAVERQAVISKAYAVLGSIQTSGINAATISYTGGFAGYNDGTLKSVYADVSDIAVKASGANVYKGSFIGYNFRDGKAEQSSYKGALAPIGRNIGAAEGLTPKDLTAGLGLSDWSFDVDTTFLSNQGTTEAVVTNAKQLAGVVLLYNDTGLDYYRLYNRAATAKLNLAKITLASDIALNNRKWVPINRFAGELDGQGHSISGLKLTAGDAGAAGFISENEGKIHHLTFAEASVEGGESTGIAAGINRAGGTIEDVSVSGTVSGQGNVGGVVGVNEGRIATTYASGTISSVGAEKVTAAGGIAGHNKAGASITESFSYADIRSASKQAAAGGIAGLQQGEIDNTYNAGRVAAQGTEEARAGGIAGLASSGTISHSLNTGEIVASVGGKLVKGKTFFGGIAGQKNNAAALIQNLFNKQMLKANFAYHDASGKSAAGQASEASGLLAAELVSTKLPAQLGAAKWKAAAGFYPRLSAFNGHDATALSTAAILLNERDSVNKIKTSFDLTADSSVKWTAKAGEALITTASGKVKGSLSTTGSAAITASINGKARTIVVNAAAIPYAETALAPTVVSGETNFTDKVTVKLATEELDGRIYYTVDGSEPDEYSLLYIEPIVLTETTTIKAMTVFSEKENSMIFSGLWTKKPNAGGGFGGGGFVPPVVTAPEISAVVGQKAADPESDAPIIVARNSKLVLSAPADQIIYYTTDGSLPTTKSLRYKGPILVTGKMTIKAITDKNDQVVTIHYEVENAKYDLKRDAASTPYMAGYESGAFKPNAALTRYELMKSLSLLLDKEDVSVGSLFSDVRASEEALVSFFNSAGIVEGYPNGTFQGERGLTRAEFVVIMSRVLKLSVTKQGAASLSDVKGHWSEKYINAFAAAGYVQGFPNGTFKPNDEISRAQAVVLINRVIGARKQSESDMHYNDLSPSHWAYGDIMSAALK
ncbi:chitobiase/beta-hexosaminidase C-terminal domain-containing protein [Paenibacillus sp. FJAT-27812]|uniref:chitobiase/beta-hexosaminidase C-terminal domain-containing protein n=1 Tax=Paenibacillus sp. FJAT-27812 TaxID=1684143 RepID=UPI0006A7A141|nr:chitobiase/beta-hexosaminidase C-terminal domain-containing protein [Paenibacillus sp. FJAT-27812]